VTGTLGIFFKQLAKLVEFVVKKQKIPNFLIKDKICEEKKHCQASINEIHQRCVSTSVCMLQIGPSMVCYLIYALVSKYYLTLGLISLLNNLLNCETFFGENMKLRYGKPFYNYHRLQTKKIHYS
jgi:hypothetical protein